MSIAQAIALLEAAEKRAAKTFLRKTFLSLEDIRRLARLLRKIKSD